MVRERALKQIIQHRPGLDAVLQRYGPQSLAGYAQAIFHEGRPLPPPGPGHTLRQLLANVIASHAAPLSALEGYEDIQARVRQRVLDVGVINTGPHHGVFGHPYLVADMLLPVLGSPPWQGPLVVLADSSVPLDNMSYPPGLFLTEKRKEESLQGKPVPIRLRLSPSKNHECLLAAKPFGGSDLVRTLSALAKLRRDGLLSAPKAELLEQLLQRMGQERCIQDASSYSEQATLMNAWLFPLLFSEPLRARLPRLVHLDCARVCTQALRELLLRHEDHLLAQFILNDRLRKAFVETTRSASVTASTDLFFGVSEDGRRVPLKLLEEGHRLVDPKGTFPEVSLERGPLLEALARGKLYAGYGLSFSLLTLADIDCVGGFNQAIGYLPAFLEALQRLLASHRLKAEAEQVSASNPLRLSTLGVAFCERQGQLERAGAFDIILGMHPSHPAGLSQEALDRCRQLTVSDWVHLNLPDLYGMTVPSEDKDAGLQEALEVRGLASSMGGVPVSFPS